MSKKTIFKPLNTLRKFKKEYEIKDYFTFFTVNHLGEQTTYMMNNEQMTEWENAQLRKNFNRVVHQMRSVHKTIEPHRGKWK